MSLVKLWPHTSRFAGNFLPKLPCFLLLAHQKYRVATTRSDGRKKEERAEPKSKPLYFEELGRQALAEAAEHEQTTAPSGY